VSARAAALLAWIALGASAPDFAPAPAECPAPRLAGARGGLAAVRCGGAPAPPPAGAARLLFGLPLDVNRAEREALEVLPGIGPARAAAIVRERTGRPFCGVDDLARVPGLGPVTRARLAPWIEVRPERGCDERSVR